ncbi:MAG: serine/threonine-protein phosphatase [Firmicutes bacterium]|nr:serine/threonine-protein phosphatase [Bacillota bacterium]
MIYRNKDFLIDLYEICLTSRTGSYSIIGERLVSELDLFAVSVWSEHPQVRKAASRIVFFQRADEPELVHKDQEVAFQALDQQALLQGTYGELFYWAKPLAGRYTPNVLIVWSKEAFDNKQLAFLAELGERLTVLLDVVTVTNPALYNRIARELRSTQFIQSQLMPPMDALGGKMFLAYRTLPAHELGGDYLDIITHSDGSIGLTVADAMGKGVPGAFVMLIARTIFRLLVKDAALPGVVLRELNKHFAAEISEVDTFVTQFYGIYDPERRHLLYANAGHHPPIIFQRSSGRMSILPGRGMALGGRPDTIYECFSTSLEVGDILLIFSDGLREARDQDNRQFGLEGITNTLIKYKEYSADGICDGLVYSVMRYSEVQDDDISFIVLKVE